MKEHSVNQFASQIKAKRENERKDAMARGLIADPDRPRELKDAVTPRGICEDMCPEFERLNRIAGNDVMGPEFVRTGLLTFR